MDWLDRWYDRWSDRDWWFLRNAVLLVAVVAGYMVVASLTLWRLVGVPPGQDLLSFVIYGTYFWLISMGPVGLIVLTILWRGRARWSHPRALAVALGLVTNAPWILYSFARVADNESAFVLIDAIAPALLFGALLRLPPRLADESFPESDVERSDWSH